jgi:hypothetical protein
MRVVILIVFLVLGPPAGFFGATFLLVAVSIPIAYLSQVAFMKPAMPSFSERGWLTLMIFFPFAYLFGGFQAFLVGLYTSLKSEKWEPLKWRQSFLATTVISVSAMIVLSAITAVQGGRVSELSGFFVYFTAAHFIGTLVCLTIIRLVENKPVRDAADRARHDAYFGRDWNS